MVKSVGTPAVTVLGIPRMMVCASDSAAGTTVKLSGDATAGMRVWACQRSGGAPACQNAAQARRRRQVPCNVEGVGCIFHVSTTASP